MKKLKKIMLSGVVLLSVMTNLKLAATWGSGALLGGTMMHGNDEINDEIKEAILGTGLVPGHVTIAMKEYTELFSSIHIVKIVDEYETHHANNQENDFGSIPSETVYRITLREKTKESVLDAIRKLNDHPDVAYARPSFLPGFEKSEAGGRFVPGEVIVRMKEYTELFAGLHIVELVDSYEKVRSAIPEDLIKNDIPMKTIYYVKLREKTIDSVFSAIDVLMARADVAYACPNYVVPADDSELLNAYYKYDLNNDGYVSNDDAAALIAHMGKSRDGNAAEWMENENLERFDLNSDCKIDMDDLTIITKAIEDKKLEQK